MQRIYVIGHLFDLTPGSHDVYAGQARYSVGHDDVIIYQAKGNRHVYRHKALPWNEQPTFVVDGVVYEAVKLDQLGTNHIWEVVATQYPVVLPNVKPLDWRALLLDDAHVGEIQTTLDERLVRQYVNEPLRLDFNRFIGAGPFVVAFVDQRRIRVPRGAVSEVANAVVGKERNPLTFTLAMQTARGYVKTSTLPVEERPVAIIAAAIIGFSLHIDFEVNMLDTARYRFSHWWSRHSQSLKLGALRAVPVITILCVLGFTDILAIVVDHYDHIEYHPITLICVILTVAVSVFLGAAWYLQRRQNQDLAETFGEVRLSDGVGVEVSDPLPINRIGVPPSTNFTPLADLESGCSVTLGIDPKPPKGPPKPTLEASGIITPTCLPVTAPSTQEAENVAVRNRVTAVNKYKVQPDAYLEYCDVFDHHPDFILLDSIHVKDDEIAAKRWLERAPYPAKKKLELEEIRKEVVSGSRIVKQRLKVHVKSDEKLLKTGLVNSAYSPRIVSATSDEHKVATGPFMWNYSNELAKCWDGKNSTVYYVRGSTAEDVGSWFGAYVNEECNGDYSNILAIEDDFVKYDRSVKSKHQKPVRRKWVKAGAAATTIEAFEHEETAGSSRHGLHFNVDDEELVSGRNDTNAKGSMVNAASHIAAISPIIHPVRKDRMGVNGDDNLILRPPNLSNSLDSVEVMTKNLQNLGLEPTIFIRRHVAEVEFCSKIFLESARYPGQWLLSPKPGRAIAKLGWTFIQSGNTLRNDALSLAKDGMHVPFLRHILRKTLELAPQTARVGKRKHTWEWEVHARDYHDNKEGTLPDSTWDIFHRRYGLTREDEEEFKTICEAITSLPAVIPTIHLSRLQEVDCPL